jgi:predicted GIY-YIG superfamily endonuclease
MGARPVRHLWAPVVEVRGASATSLETTDSSRDPQASDLGLKQSSSSSSVAAMAWTYILECVDGSYYVGSTMDLEARVWQHNNDPDGPIYTRRRRPVSLVWAAEYDSVEHAFLYEKQIQGWNRAKREALIRGDFEALPDLSRRKAVQDREAAEDKGDAE